MAINYWGEVGSFIMRLVIVFSTLGIILDVTGGTPAHAFQFAIGIFFAAQVLAIMNR